MSVSTPHRQYASMLPIWQRNEDAAAGEAAVKARSTTYLPVPNPDETDRFGERYQTYLLRAVYTNYVGRTIDGLTGAVFRNETAVELPTQLEYMQYAATCGGLSLQTVAQAVVGGVLATGRYILLADFPEGPDEATDEATAGLRARIAQYPATALINWHTAGGTLDLAVIQEQREEPMDDGFTYDPVTYYRALRLREEGATLQLYREETPETEEVIIRMSDGSPFREIPLVIVGSEDNNAEPDSPPISDIAALNIAHYRNSADYEEGVFLHGQPWPHVSVGDMSADQFVESNPDVHVGSRRALVTGNGGKVELVQAEANGAAFEAMTHKETSMVRLGAQIIADAKGQETAEAARIRSGAETSVLNTVVRNVSEGFEKALRWCALFMGGDPEQVEYRLNEQFFPAEIDPQVMAQIIMGVDRGFWPASVAQDAIRRAGYVDGDESNDELTERARQDPLL